MNAVFFPNWSNALAGSALPPEIVNSHKIAIRWFLSYLGSMRQPATVETARAFIEFAVEKKSPQPWMVERWKAGIRWFFVNAPVRKPLQKKGKGISQIEKGEAGEEEAHEKKGRMERAGIGKSPARKRENLASKGSSVRERDSGRSQAEAAPATLLHIVEKPGKCLPTSLSRVAA